LHWSVRYGGTMTQPTVVQVQFNPVKLECKYDKP